MYLYWCERLIYSILVHNVCSNKMLTNLSNTCQVNYLMLQSLQNTSVMRILFVGLMTIWMIATLIDLPKHTFSSAEANRTSGISSGMNVTEPKKSVILLPATGLPPLILAQDGKEGKLK